MAKALSGLHLESATLEDAMRTTIDIDDDLLVEAMVASGLTTKKATVEAALRRLAHHHHRRNSMSDMAGLGWEGDPDPMRDGREL